MNKILITRPQEKAEMTARDISVLGASPLIAPVLQVVPLAFDCPDAEDYAGLLFTSSHAAALFAGALAGDSLFYRMPVFTVGDETARLAGELGFMNVRSAGGDVQDLIQVVAGEAVPGPYLHVRGRHVSVPLHVLLSGLGQAVDILQVYETKFADDFSRDVVRALKNGEVTAVMLYSSRSAEAFSRLVERHNLAEYLATIKVLSISHAVLGCVQSYLWQSQHVAEKPDQHSFYDLLRCVCL